MSEVQDELSWFWKNSDRHVDMIPHVVDGESNDVFCAVSLAIWWVYFHVDRSFEGEAVGIFFCYAFTLRHTQHSATQFNTMQPSATRCNTLYHAITHWGKGGKTFLMWHTATHCNILQHIATHCNTQGHEQGSLFFAIDCTDAFWMFGCVYMCINVFFCYYHICMSYVYTVRIYMNIYICILCIHISRFICIRIRIYTYI